MDNSSTLIAVSTALLLGAGVILIVIGIWTIRALVPRSIASKYPRHVLRMSHLPFAEKWRSGVDSEDLPLFLRARARRFVFLLTALALSHVIPAYAYLHVVAELRRCHVRELNLLGELASPGKKSR